MNKTVIRIPPSPLYDMEAMESWLTDMAREGLYLERQGIDWGLGHFYRGEPRALPYRLVSSLEHPTLWQRLRQSRRAPNQEARELAAQAGWEYVSLHQSFYVYRATTEHPREMETDYQLQAAAIRRVLWWYAVSLFLILLLLFVLFLLLWFSCGQSIWGIVRESFALPFLFPLGIASVVVQYGRILHYFREMSQKLALGDALNHRKPWRAQTKRRLAIRWTIVGMVVVFGVGIFPSGTVSLPPPPAPDYPFATVSDLLPAGYAYQREPENFSFQRRPNPFFPQDLLWMEDGTLTTPDGRTCQVGFRLQYTRTAFLSAAQWCFQTAWKELIAQGRVHAESLALPGLDQAKLVQDAFGSCLLLRQGTQVWRVSLNHMEDGVWPPALWQEAVLRSLGITVPA